MELNSFRILPNFQPTTVTPKLECHKTGVELKGGMAPPAGVGIMAGTIPPAGMELKPGMGLKTGTTVKAGVAIEAPAGLRAGDRVNDRPVEPSVG